MFESITNYSQDELKSLGRVAVIMGGNASERQVSLNSGHAVLTALQSAGVDAFALDLTGDGQNPLTQLVETDFDRAFLIVHGPGGEDGQLQGALELINKPYTGSGVAASAVGMDKMRTKQLWLGAGLPTPAYASLCPSSDFEQIVEDLGLPLMVKPANEGSSIGMSRVSSAEELRDAYALAAQFDSRVIAEQWVNGPEFTVAILNGRALPIIRLVTPHEFYDFDAKYQANDTQYLFDTGLDNEQIEQMQRLVEQAFQVVGCSGWGRVDLMMDQAGQFQLLEVNTIPGMTDHSLVPMAAKQAGISFAELCVEIVMEAR
jgi:D-alanine-D-alanine ligase